MSSSYLFILSSSYHLMPTRFLDIPNPVRNFLLVNLVLDHVYYCYCYVYHGYCLHCVLFFSN